MNLPVVVRKEVWIYLQSQNSDFTKEVRQSIDKIQKGQFDFGLRVKKLKGVSLRVWEARINKASRLLFTYRQSHDTNAVFKKVIAVEAVCKEHDDVSSQARNIDRNWYEVEELETLGSLDIEYGLLSIDEQEKIYSCEIEELEVRAELTDELLANIQWLILEPEIIESEQEWQKAIESGADLRLRLTPDESNVINTNGNILLSGNAGTGKTTVGLYRLAKVLQANNNAKCLYVAYNPILVQESKEQFKKLSGNDIQCFPGLEFLTIRDLCSQVLKDLGKNFDRQIVDYSYFYQHYSQQTQSKKYPPSLVWNEIRSIIKGAKLTDPHNSHLLSLSEYEDLGGKRSEIIQKSDRPEIYKLAEWYQNYINSKKLADEVDLAQTTLQIINEQTYHPYTSIVCDEIQDLVEIQLEILIRLLAKNGEFLCAGDINQMISPSGFRWGDLTTRLYSLPARRS